MSKKLLASFADALPPYYKAIILLCLFTILCKSWTATQLASIAFKSGVSNVSNLAIIEGFLDVMTLASTVISFISGGILLLICTIYYARLLVNRSQTLPRVVILGISSAFLIFASTTNIYQLGEAISNSIELVDPTLYEQVELPNRLSQSPEPNKNIEESVKTSTLTLKSLAGEYYLGDGFGVNEHIRVESNGTFDYKWTGCCGTYSACGGTAALQDGLLILTSYNASNGAAPWGKPIKLHSIANPVTRKYLPIIWAERTYLIEPEQMIKFCISVNAGGEPRNIAQGFYYLKTDEWQKCVSGLPALPQPWDKLQFNRTSRKS